jgi:ACS family hexuronate transporter-like MFS transporter
VKQRSNLRWQIFFMLLAINLVNNLDRQVLGLVAPAMQNEFAWGELGYARIVAAFQISFALMNLVSGRLVDQIGVRFGLAIAMLWFSVAQVAHVLARGAVSFGLVRVGLAFGEAPVYPATLKSLAEWAPQNERSAAAGLVHFGVMLGAIVAPLFIPWTTEHWGWQSGFLITGALGFALLGPWLWLYDKPETHRMVTPAERSLVLGDRRTPADAPPLSWFGLFRRRQLWAYVVLQALANPAWWFVVYWLPKFLGEAFGIKGAAMTPFVVAVYTIAAVGALVGGNLSRVLLARGCTLNQSRKYTLLLCGLTMPLVIIAGYTRSAWLAVAVIGIAAFVHQTWTATGAAILADLFPAQSVASVVGIGSFIGSLAGVAAAEATGRLLHAHPGFYLPMFLYAGFAYLAATGLMHLLSPRLQPVDSAASNPRREPAEAL